MGNPVCSNHRSRSVCRKYHRKTLLTVSQLERSLKTKSVATINELVAKGYPRSLLLQIAHSEVFPELGFSTGDKRKNYHFYIDKLQKYLERREQYDR